MTKIISKININLSIIILSLLISLTIAKYNINNFDKIINIGENNYRHLMIKNDVYRYLSNGYSIKEDLTNGKSYFDSGADNFTKYLYPRILALYYYVFDYDFYEDQSQQIIKKGIHLNYLLIQSLIYYLSIIFFYYQTKDYFNNKIIFFILLFLCLEPTLLQYHSTFWSESIFFSIQLFLTGLILNNTQTKTRYFLIGVLLSLLALQRSSGFFYIIPVIIYLYFSVKSNLNKKILYIFFGFSLLLIFVGYDNYKKTSKFYIFPSEMKAVVHAYIIPNIITKDEMEKQRKDTLTFIKNKKFKLDFNIINKIEYSRFSFYFCNNVGAELVKLEAIAICDYLKVVSYKTVLNNPMNTIKHVLTKTVSFILINPFHIYSDHVFLSGEIYYGSELHKSLIKYRLVYSIIIFSICLIGIYSMIKNKKKNFLFFSLISSAYFILILSWHGNNRYFTPVLIYLSLLFSYGIVEINDFLQKKIKHKNTHNL